MKFVTACVLFTLAAVAFLSVTGVEAKKPEGKPNPAIGQPGEGGPDEMEGKPGAPGEKPCKECQGKGTVPDKDKKGKK